MAVTSGIAFGVFVIVAIAAPLALYVLVRAEGETEEMDREEAERAARRDIDDRR
ncbi:MAG: type II secretory pathway pseudopilin PulG [Natronomonas sp.]|jgi:type II secretory pathway pseudopilin PulG